MARNSDLAIVFPLIDEGIISVDEKYSVCKKVAEFKDNNDDKGLAAYIKSLKNAPKKPAAGHRHNNQTVKNTKATTATA